MALVRPSTPEDFSELGELMRYSYGHSVSVEELQRLEHGLPPGMVRQRWVAEEAGRLVGFSSALRAASRKPGWFGLRVSVDPSARRRGIGSALYAVCLSFVESQGATELRMLSRDEDADSERFVRNRGFQLRQRAFESRLDPSEFDSSVHRAADLASAGITLIPFSATKMDEEARDKLFRLHSETSQDVPGAEVFGEPNFDDFRHMFLDAPSFDPGGVILAVKDGEWLGMSSVGPMPGGHWFNTMTGVRREARGQGLGYAMKLAAIAYAKSRGVTDLRTDNDSTNAPMLAINEKLGYRRLPGWLVWDLRLEETPAPR